MGKSPKFMVFHLRELIYTVVFVLLGIVLVISLIFMFCNKNNDEKEKETSSGQYEAGVYTSCVTLNGNPMEVTVTLDSDHINSITVDNISDTITTMYPLVEPAFEDIAKQIVDTQSIENIKFSEDSQYTYTMLYNAIVDTIDQGKNK
ncbi:hypothetical protein [uncultured Eubacterium sp.]|uniref:hypothetical protein n=1 Tax=uncultured Eubacterium sp. TaxID=165185 RepID=UPI00267216A7|nr:hypothetical protein [uncultured Eubacterium sp.]